MYVCMYVYSSCHLVVGVFARQMHSTSEFALTVLSKCVPHAGSSRWHEPFEEYLSR